MNNTKTITIDPEVDIMEEVRSILETKKDTGFQIMLWNDDVNSFDHVIECLVKYCNHEAEQAHQCAMIVHNNGKCSVKRGGEKDLKPIKEALLEAHLTATIEKVS